MPAGRRADTCPVAPLRRILHAALPALGACALIGPAAALGAPARAHRSARCARAGSSHVRSRRANDLKGCPKPHPHSARRRPTAPHRTVAADVGANCPDAGLVPSESDVERIRAATLCLVNRERAAHGERPLQTNARLRQAAQSHTESMADDDYFEHIGPGGDTPLTRLRAVGYIYSSQI